MKKSLFFLGVGVLAMLSVAGCKNTKNPYDDTTKLYPAGVSTTVKSESDMKFGYIGKKGSMDIAAQFTYAATFSCGYANVETGSLDTYIDKKGNIQSVPVSSDGYCTTFWNDYARVSDNGKYGFLDKKLNYAVPAIYASLGRMSKEKLAWERLSSNDDKYGFINGDGEQKIAEQFSEAYVFTDGVAAVKMGDRWGAIDKKGNWKIQPVYYDLFPLGEDLYGYLEDSKDEYYGVINTSGKVIAPKQFQDLGSFGDNSLCPVKRDGKWGYMNTKGDIKINCIYSYAMPFSDGYAFVYLDNDDETCVMIDKKGGTKLQLSKDEDIYSDGQPVWFPHNGLFLVANEQEDRITYSYRDTDGNTVYSWTWTYESSSWDYDYYYAPRRAKVQKFNEKRMEGGINFGLGKKQLH